VSPTKTRNSKTQYNSEVRVDITKLLTGETKGIVIKSTLPSTPGSSRPHVPRRSRPLAFHFFRPLSSQKFRTYKVSRSSGLIKLAEVKALYYKVKVIYLQFSQRFQLQTVLVSNEIMYV
jgi:hypothetical protein